MEEQNNLKIVSYKGIRKSDIDKIRENIDNSVILDILIKNFNLFLQINLKYDEKIIGYILLRKKITNESYTKEEQEHLEILGNIAAIALTNAKHLQQVNDINNELKVKVKQLSTLFEIGQEFNLTQYDKQKVYKLLIYTLLGQFLISKYCLIEFVKEELNILENKFDGALTKSLEYEKLLKIDSILNKNQIKNYIFVM